MNILDATREYTLYNEHESVYLKNATTNKVITVGDHYGDPACGIIGPYDRWCLSAGEGVQIYDMEEGFSSFWHPLATSPPEYVRGLSREETPETLLSTLRFVHDARLQEDGTVRILVDPWSDEASVWSLHVTLKSLIKICDGPFLRDEPYRGDVEY